MESVVERTPRRVVSEHELRDDLRRLLMDNFRADRRYLAIVRQDLGPRWRHVAAVNGLEHGRPPTFREVNDLRARLEEHRPGSATWAATDGYVRAVLSTVVRSLRMTRSGLWSAWAAAEVHEDASERSSERWKAHVLIPKRPRDPQDDRFGLTLDLSANLVSFQLAHWTPGAADEVVEARDVAVGEFGYSPEHWQTLKDATYKIISWAVDEIRLRIEALHPAHNSASLVKLQQDVVDLYRWLFHQDRPKERAVRERLRRLCKQIDLDLPDGSNGPRLIMAQAAAHQSAAPPEQ